MESDMSMQCQKCFYQLTKTEAISYLTIQMGPVLKDVILPYLISLYAKRGFGQYLDEMTQDAILPLLNHYKMVCHVCMSYQGWSRDIRSSVAFEDATNEQQK